LTKLDHVKEANQCFDKENIGDRSHLIERNLPGKSWSADPDKLRRIITAYSIMDEEAGYCSVGYNYIVALLCRFISPHEGYDLTEEYVFWTLFSIMNELEFREYFIKDH
jgi:hypothetical protein